MPHPGYGTPDQIKFKAPSTEFKDKAAKLKATSAEVTPKVATKPTKADPMNCDCPKTKNCACHAQTANLAQISSFAEAKIPPMSVRMA